jgi:hypothetical protein
VRLWTGVSRIMKIDYEKFKKLKRKDWVEAAPFPHVVIDNLFDKDYLLKVLEEFPGKEDVSWWKYDNIFEKKLAYNNFFNFKENTSSFFDEINSRKFVKEIENLTGISGLIADPSLRGGGLHKIGKGGKLDIHSDFPYHKPTGWKRALNIITFLNLDWKDEYGGHTELWDYEMENCIQKISPIFNRTIIFSVHESAWHGHPHPLACPKETSRMLAAAYYYVLEEETLDIKYTSTSYQKLPDQETTEEIEEMRKKRKMGRLKDIKT